MTPRRHGDALTLACQGWTTSPHAGHGTLTIQLSAWYGRLVADVIAWEASA